MFDNTYIIGKRDIFIGVCLNSDHFRLDFEKNCHKIDKMFFLILAKEKLINQSRSFTIKSKINEENESLNIE